MPLGLLAKDSMLNLTELASSKIEDGSEKNATKQLALNGDICFVQQIVDSEQEITSPLVSVSHGGESKIHTDTTKGNTIISNSFHDTNPSGDNSVSSSLDHRVPQDAIELSANKRYSGFSADYYDYENNAYHLYSSYSFDGEKLIPPEPHVNSKNDNDKPCWLCIFPWFSSRGNALVEEEQFEHQGRNRNKVDPSFEVDINTTDAPSRKSTQSGVKNDDEISMVSAGSDDLLGEKLSQKDHQAVLARLRLAQPVTKNPREVIINNDGSNGNTFSVSSRADPNGLLDCNIQTNAEGIPKKKIKSILKRNVSINRNINQSNVNNKSNTSKRRSLFPPTNNMAVTKNKNHVTFTPMARFTSIKSFNDMDELEKSSIWWQKEDYDEFRKTGRLVSKAILQGGSEIWLASNQSWQLPNQGKSATLRRALENADTEDTDEKWWHKFGHSRRGLEHIASMDEGRQRQANVRNSVKAVLIEQRRQRAFHREDPDKVRMVSLQYTSWAKDLALASGASDADCVTKNFDDENRKSREFYLLKFSRSNQSIINSSSTNAAATVIPTFMKPSTAMMVRPNRLDQNTMSQIKFRQTQEKTANRNRVPSDTMAVYGDEGTGLQPSIHLPIHDETNSGPKKDTLAKKGEYLYCYFIDHDSYFVLGLASNTL